MTASAIVTLVFVLACVLLIGYVIDMALANVANYGRIKPVLWLIVVLIMLMIVARHLGLLR